MLKIYMKYQKALIATSIIIIIIVAWNYIKKPSSQASVILQVPFTSQAPNGNWDRNEDCEETSIAMAAAFINGQSEDRMPAVDAQNAINQLKNWENINTGYNANTGAEATTKLAQGAFKIKVKQISDFTEQDLKNALSTHDVILLPLNAKMLSPGKYGDVGPLYHMIVLRGYKGDTFIVNDPGTDSGDGNVYTFETLKKAAADWNQNTKSIDPNRKIALVLSK